AAPPPRSVRFATRTRAAWRAGRKPGSCLERRCASATSGRSTTSSSSRSKAAGSSPAARGSRACWSRRGEGRRSPMLRDRGRAAAIREHETRSLAEVHRTVPLPPAGSWLRRMFAFAGPAYLVSVGYMDPGNWATDLAGGARFGYQLLWVLVLSNLMAILLQTLSARLGIVTGRDLAQTCRDAYPRSVSHA